jgi:phosphatidate cytidylyltransferase
MRSRFNINNYSNLGQRAITAVIGGLIVVGGTIYSEWTYFLVFAGILGFSQMEFYKLSGLDGMLPLKSFGTFLGLMIFSLTFMVEKEHLPMEYLYMIFPIVSLTFLGIFYVAVPFSLLNLAVFSVDGVYKYEILIGCLLILWATDTGAYFAGTRFGKTKLFERVSPKKSWEGFLGGAFSAIAVAFVIAKYFHTIADWKWLVIAGIIIIAGTYGDLIESLFKRSIEIKDSGNRLPGHGGFMDRFDGLLLSAPFITAFLKIF